MKFKPHKNSLVHGITCVIVLVFRSPFSTRAESGMNVNIKRKCSSSDDTVNFPALTFTGAGGYDILSWVWGADIHRSSRFIINHDHHRHQFLPLQYSFTFRPWFSHGFPNWIFNQLLLMLPLESCIFTENSTCLLLSFPLRVSFFWVLFHFHHWGFVFFYHLRDDERSVCPDVWWVPRTPDYIWDIRKEPPPGDRSQIRG